MRKLAAWILKAIAFLLLILLSYFVVAVGGSLIPVNLNQPPHQDYEIFIETNGVHTDIVMPLYSPVMDWTKLVDPGHTRSGKQYFPFVAFGWGDLDFYQNTPQWSDVTPTIAVRALFFQTPAAMHVKFKTAVEENDTTISIKLSRSQYEKLAEYIRQSFIVENDKAVPIPNLHYSNSDAFYEATGSLTLFYTCNTWTNRALKYAGLKASLWTPFSEGIFYRYS